MKNEFIPYEQALALKELGFDEPCISVYYVDKRLSEPMSTWVITNDNTNSKRKSDLISCSVPTFSQAFRWFREEHNLCGEVYTVNMGAIDYTFQIRDLYSEDVKHDNFEAYTGGYIGTFLTYEEAEQACLDKLIEIVKNETTKD